MNKNKNTGSTQGFIPIKEIKDGIVVLDDGTFVSISLVTSINISLKSSEEKALTISAFQDFLNILEFPVQISIQSRKLNIEPYLEVLETRIREQQSEIIKLQTIEYISFIKNFTDSINIMEKQFFLIVSYKPSGSSLNKKELFSIFSRKSKEEEHKSSKIVFEEGINQLEQRVDLLNSGLSRTGVKIKRLDTESALEVFYSIFNSGDVEITQQKA